MSDAGLAIERLLQDQLLTTNAIRRVVVSDVSFIKGAFGWCGFCGIGEGHLGDQGDEMSQLLHSSVRYGEPGLWTYESHPNSIVGADNLLTHQIHWCGRCIPGLKHMFQRYDDTNLRAYEVSGRLRLEMDGIRWSVHFSSSEDRTLRALADDDAIHMDKLRLERSVHFAEMERMRRLGADLTTRGWREGFSAEDILSSR